MKKQILIPGILTIILLGLLFIPLNGTVDNTFVFFIGRFHPIILHLPIGVGSGLETDRGAGRAAVSGGGFPGRAFPPGRVPGRDLSYARRGLREEARGRSFPCSANQFHEAVFHAEFHEELAQIV